MSLKATIPKMQYYSIIGVNQTMLEVIELFDMAGRYAEIFKLIRSHRKKDIY